MCAIDLNIRGRHLRMICAYMPTAWDADIQVEGVYRQMSRLCEEARKANRTPLIFGDFNAVVGNRIPQDNASIVGENGLGIRNERGQWLVDWATLEQQMILNTRFRKPACKQWTHSHENLERQIDFGLAPKRRWLIPKNAEACQDITVGTDHRCLRLDFKIHIMPKQESNKKKVR